MTALNNQRVLIGSLYRGTSAASHSEGPFKFDHEHSRSGLTRDDEVHIPDSDLLGTTKSTLAIFEFTTAALTPIFHCEGFGKPVTSDTDSVSSLRVCQHMMRTPTTEGKEGIEYHLDMVSSMIAVVQASSYAIILDSSSPRTYTTKNLIQPSTHLTALNR